MRNSLPGERAIVYILNRAAILFMIILPLTLTNCIAFRGGMVTQLQTVQTDPAAGAPAIGTRITVLDDGEPAGYKAVYWATVTIHDELEKSGAFASVAAANGQPFVLDILIDERCSSTVGTVTRVLATLTVGVLPLYVRCEFELQAVLRRDGLEIKRYRLQDYETDVGWLFFAFVQPFVDARWGSTLNNLTRHLVKQMVSDGWGR